jgi:DNA uptake protein ComE-like DNA-binding protein
MRIEPPFTTISNLAATEQNLGASAMSPSRTPNAFGLLLAAAFIFGVCIGCNSNDPDQRAREEKTREEVARATANAKPAIENAGRKIGEAAHDAADQARAAAQGVRDGWNESHHGPLDLNSASESQLDDLPGIDKRIARRIIDGRPYHEKRDLLDKGIVSNDEYEKIRNDVITK